MRPAKNRTSARAPNLNIHSSPSSDKRIDPLSVGPALAGYNLRGLAVHGGYCIAAHARDVIQERDGPEYALFRKNIAPALGAAVHMWLIKNGESENLGQRLREHRAGHFRHVASARVVIVAPTEAGLGGYLQYMFNHFASRFGMVIKAHGTDWFVLSASRMLEYKYRLNYIYRGMHPVELAVRKNLTALDEIETSLHAVEREIEERHTPEFTAPSDKGVSIRWKDEPQFT